MATVRRLASGGGDISAARRLQAIHLSEADHLAGVSARISRRLPRERGKCPLAVRHPLLSGVGHNESNLRLQETLLWGLERGLQGECTREEHHLLGHRPCDREGLGGHILSSLDAQLRL